VATVPDIELDPEEERRPGIWQLAFPSILGNLSFTIVAMVQTKFVGELGAQALAAVGAGQRVFFAMQAILMAVSVGTTALVARAWGARDYREASRVTMASLVLAGTFWACCSLIRWRAYLGSTRRPWSWRPPTSAGCACSTWPSP